jgi:acetoin:2,6-dichlorophenolindophenol oxidoreductase subunit beta
VRQITYCQALREALLQEMERDSRVFVYGIGVPDHKAVFDSTAGLPEKFGPMRCFDTPLSEDAMTGFGLGAALSGLRPVHVHIRMDFMMLAFNQISNLISSYAYLSGGSLHVPMVIRGVIGRGWGQGSQHSKSMHAAFAHVPGLKVVMPTTAYDAKGLLISAIRDNNPVVFIEHRWLYWQRGDVPEEPYTVPLGRASVLREGRDLTIVATSWMNVEATLAADILGRHGLSVEIVDPRTIAPLDEDTIVRSVEKTGRCLVADNDWPFCGFSAEVAARISARCFSALKAPVERVGFAETPCPTPRHLENLFYPNAETIVRRVERMLGLEPIDVSGVEFYSHEKKFKGPF